MWCAFFIWWKAHFTPSRAPRRSLTDPPLSTLAASRLGFRVPLKRRGGCGPTLKRARRRGRFANPNLKFAAALLTANGFAAGVVWGAIWERRRADKLKFKVCASGVPLQ